MTEYNEMSKGQIREEEYEGENHYECPDCGHMIYFTPCVHCNWEDE